jgi:hypothetical protein
MKRCWQFGHLKVAVICTVERFKVILQRGQATALIVFLPVVANSGRFHWFVPMKEPITPAYSPSGKRAFNRKTVTHGSPSQSTNRKIQAHIFSDFSKKSRKLLQLLKNR